MCSDGCKCVVEVSQAEERGRQKGIVEERERLVGVILRLLADGNVCNRSYYDCSTFNTCMDYWRHFLEANDVKG